MSRLVEGVQVLVRASDGHACLVFFHHEQGFHGKHGLQRFPEVGGGVGGNPGVDFGYFQQLSLALRVGLLSGQVRGVLGESFCVCDHPFGGIDDGFIEINLVDIFGVLVIQGLKMRFGFGLNIQHALFHKDHVIARVRVASAVYGVVGTVRDK